MAIGLLLGQGENDEKELHATVALSSLHDGRDGKDSGWQSAESTRLSSKVLSSPVPTPIPLPPAEALPYVSKEFDLCIHNWECEIASRVQRCENPSGDPWNISSTGDYGIMQINRRTWEWWLNQRGFNFETEWMIPERNVAMAFAIWEDHWWWEWSCF